MFEGGSGRDARRTFGLFSPIVSELLTQRIEKVRGLMRARLEQMYRLELETLKPASRNTVLIALEALTDFSVWRRIRERHGFSIEQASAIWIESVDRLLPPTPAA